jgi:hypothetical protein
MPIVPIGPGETDPGEVGRPSGGEGLSASTASTATRVAAKSESGMIEEPIPERLTGRRSSSGPPALPAA